MYSTEGMNVGTGWGPLWGGVIGGIGGYLIGRNNGGAFGYNAPCGVVAPNNCQTCFQEGEYTGENRAGINFIAQTVNRNQDEIQAVNANVNAQFASLKDQKIQDLMAENAALRTQAVVSNSLCGVNNKLDLLAHEVSSITTGCAVRSVPACSPRDCSC